MLKKITACGWALAWGLAGAQVIDLNQATEITLDGLKGVGPALTREVLSERDKAPFKDWNDVTRRVKGIGPRKANQLSEQGVRVQGLPFAEQTSAQPTPIQN